MKAVFNDLQEHSSSIDGAAVRNRLELFSVLDGAREREPFVCELQGENGYKLTLGLGSDCGFVQHCRVDGAEPYLLAVAEMGARGAESVEFLCGDTPSPVPGRNVLPFDELMEVAAHFVETGERSPRVLWEEI
jgi:hypothetical protein